MAVFSDVKQKAQSETAQRLRQKAAAGLKKGAAAGADLLKKGMADKDKDNAYA